MPFVGIPAIMCVPCPVSYNLVYPQYCKVKVKEFAEIVLSHKQPGSFHSYSRNTLNLPVVGVRLGVIQTHSPYMRVCRAVVLLTDYLPDVLFPQGCP